MRPSVLFLALFLTACQRPAPPQVAAAPASTAPTPVVADASGRPSAAKPRSAAPLELTTGYVPSQMCNLEGIAGLTFGPAPIAVQRGAPAVASGWAGIESSKAAPARVLVRVALVSDASSAWEVELPVNVRREDVAQATGSSAMVSSGFAYAIDFSGIPAGDYHLFLTYQDGALHIVCDNGRYIQLLG